jgi:hypothetical protein
MYLLSEFDEKIVDVDSVDGFEYQIIKPFRPGLTTKEEYDQIEPDLWVVAIIGSGRVPLCITKTVQEAKETMKTIARIVSYLNGQDWCSVSSDGVISIRYPGGGREIREFKGMDFSDEPFIRVTAIRDYAIKNLNL